MLNNVNWGQAAFSTGMGALTSYFGGQIGNAISPYTSGLLSGITNRFLYNALDQGINNAISGFVGHLIIGGQFNLILLLFLGSGSVIGGFLGPRILAKINVQTLEKVYGILLILLVISFGIIMLFK